MKIILIILLLIILYCFFNNKEHFVDTKPKIDTNYNFNYNINERYINELATKIVKSTKINPDLIDLIDKKVFDILHDCSTNDDLKFYLKFMNQINDDNSLVFKYVDNEKNKIDKGIPTEFPVYESSDNFLHNKIKIILLLFPRNELNLII